MFYRTKLPNFIILLPLTVHVWAMYRTEYGIRGGAVIEALRYNSEGRGFDPDGVIGIFL